MSTATIVRRAFDVFQADVRSPPPLTIRGGNAVDGYDHRAQRLDGLTNGDSPAESQTRVMIFATALDEVATLSIRSWPRDDLAREVERIAGSFEIIEP